MRVSAINALGFGIRRLTAPPMLQVPITQPSEPTQLEAVWAAPRAYLTTQSTVMVKIGPSAFDGGAVITHYNLEWDTVSTFDSGSSGSSLGSAEVPAYSYICQACVSDIEFSYDEASPVVTVHYSGSSDTVRQLQAGARVVIITTDDNLPYTFVVGATQPTSSVFTLENAGLRETVFRPTSGSADLLLMKAEYEIDGLLPGYNYFFRASAENSAGVCNADLAFDDECGKFTLTVPSSIIPRQAPGAPEMVQAVVVDAKSVEVKWAEPASISDITAYRVDAFQKSPGASPYFSFFGDDEVQQFTTSTSSVTSGTFTIA